MTRPRPPFGQVLVGTLNHKNYNVYLPKAFETLAHENVTVTVFFIVCTIYFLVVLLKCLIRSEECVRMCKDYVISWEITTVPKIAVEMLIHGKCYRHCFLYSVWKIYFSGFIEALDSKGIVLRCTIFLAFSSFVGDQTQTSARLSLGRDFKSHFTLTHFSFIFLVLFTERACPQLAKANLGRSCLNKQITKKIYTDKNKLIKRGNTILGNNKKNHFTDLT